MRGVADGAHRGADGSPRCARRARRAGRGGRPPRVVSPAESASSSSRRRAGGPARARGWHAASARPQVDAPLTEHRVVARASARSCRPAGPRGKPTRWVARRRRRPRARRGRRPVGADRVAEQQALRGTMATSRLSAASGFANRHAVSSTSPSCASCSRGMRSRSAVLPPPPWRPPPPTCRRRDREAHPPQHPRGTSSGGGGSGREPTSRNSIERPPRAGGSARGSSGSTKSAARRARCHGPWTRRRALKRLVTQPSAMSGQVSMASRSRRRRRRHGDGGRAAPSGRRSRAPPPCEAG